MSPARDEVLRRVAALLRDLLPTAAGAGALEEGTGLLGHGIGIDSVEALQLVAAAEKEFGLTVPDEDLFPEHFETVGTFVTFVERRLG